MEPSGGLPLATVIELGEEAMERHARPPTRRQEASARVTWMLLRLETPVRVLLGVGVLWAVACIAWAVVTTGAQDGTPTHDAATLLTRWLAAPAHALLGVTALGATGWLLLHRHRRPHG